MSRNERKYKKEEVITFRSTKESFGALSNMASGFSILVNDVIIPSSEALYQACRYPSRYCCTARRSYRRICRCWNLIRSFALVVARPIYRKFRRLRCICRENSARTSWRFRSGYRRRLLALDSRFCR